jgi:hypothetical protein
MAVRIATFSNLALFMMPPAAEFIVNLFNTVIGFSGCQDMAQILDRLNPHSPGGTIASLPVLDILVTGPDSITMGLGHLDKLSPSLDKSFSRIRFQIYQGLTRSAAG